jgi:hypothetical protein
MTRASILSQPDFVKRLRVPFDHTRFSATAVSVEKVLVGHVNDVLPDAKQPGRQIPYDAQVWIVLDWNG